MHIVIAPGRLKPGITETAMLDIADRFQRDFVAQQLGILRRTLVADPDGGYADIIVFTDEAAIAEVMAAEQTSPVCHEFMGVWDDPQVTVYRVLRSHDR